MIPRTNLELVRARLTQFPAVALLGPRQVGKTTLAHELARIQTTVYLDLELSSDRNKLDDPVMFLSRHEDKLVVIDEIHRIPELFQALRSLIDDGRRRGLSTNRFLLLGSASIDLLKQSGESLAGRVAYIELEPFNILEVGESDGERLWSRGGFPDSFLASDDNASVIWRNSFLRTYLERDIPQLGPRIPGETLRRFWTMLAHLQGGTLNAAELARSLGVDPTTIVRYLDLLVDLLLVRRLLPFHANIGKRLVKAPRLYIRDSGITHSMLGIRNLDALLGHPVSGGSWEGFVIENLISLAPDNTTPYFYRTANGAEVDLVLDMSNGERWAIEIKRSSSPTLERGFYVASGDLKPTRSFIVYPGRETYTKGEDTQVIGLTDLATRLANLR